MPFTERKMGKLEISEKLWTKELKLKMLMLISYPSLNIKLPDRPYGEVPLSVLFPTTFRVYYTTCVEGNNIMYLINRYP